MPSSIASQPRPQACSDEAPAPLLLVGGSGHAAVVADVARSGGRFAPVGCTTRSGDEPACGLPRLGDDACWAAIRATGVVHAFVAIGDNRRREALARRLRALGFGLPTLVHAAATVSHSARLGDGVAVMAGAVVNAGAAVAALAILNTRCVVEHDAAVGPAAHLAPGAILTGRARVGARATIGPGAIVVAGIAVGDDTIIGAGSVVLRDLPAGVRAWGTPARVVL